MGTPTRGTVALVPFPFSDLSQAKLRPAVVIANAGKLFTAHETLIRGEAGRLRPDAFEPVRAGVLRVLE
jgi:hypothetical protein